MKFEVKNGSFSYENKLIFQNLNLSLNDGEICCILGPNGAGKTTLLKCILGFEKLKTGEVLIDDTVTLKISSKDFWKKISYVPQIKNPVFSYSVFDMVMMGCSKNLSVFSIPSAKDEEKVLNTLIDCGILHLKDKNCNQLSGGEMQLVFIARGMVSNPRLLILDEPEANLDFKNQLVILDLLKRLSEEKNISILMNTHSPTHAYKISQKSLLLLSDATSIFGETEKIINAENMEKTFGVEVQFNEVQTEKSYYKSVEPVKII